MDSYKAVVKYSKGASINAAYIKMTSNIAVILKTKDVTFDVLRRACFQEIITPGSTLPKSLAYKIQPTKSLDEMLDLLALSPYWNWFDTRLLQALVSASGSPEAEEWLEIFKATFYTKKVTEVIPYVSIKPFPESKRIVEKFDKDPKDLTISELLEHKYKLEDEVLDIDEGELVLSCIKTGCVELTWQIPQELVYRAYTSMKKKHDELSSLAVKSLVCEAAERYVGLPILWRGQEVGEVGPIEPLPEHVRQEPYSLPQGFQWVPLSSSDAIEIEQFAAKHWFKSIHRFIVYYHMYYPNSKIEWQFAIRTTDNKLVGVVVANRVHICIGKTSMTCLYPAIVHHSKYRNKRIFYMLNKELMRRANLYNINQFVVFKNEFTKPITTSTMWKYQFNHPSTSQLPSSPRTPGWRRMTSEDVPSALAFINKWSSQFEIRQVFNSEEECSFYLLDLCPAILKYIRLFTYVVQNKNNNITDLVRYILPFDEQGFLSATSTVVMSTQSPAKQLIMDALVCAKEDGADCMTMYQHDIASDILSSLSFQQVEHTTCHIYNYKHCEIPHHKFWFTIF